MSVPKRHHLLPAFYLRGFCDKGLHEKEDHESNPNRCRVWIHDRTQGSVRVSGVANVAVEKHFYSADVPGGGRDPEPEQKLSVLEGKAAGIIRALRYGRNLSMPDRAELARFVGVMKFRTPSFRTWMEVFADQKAKELNKARFPTEDALLRYLRQRGAPVDALPQMAERMYKDIHDEAYTLQVSKNYMLLQMFELGEEVGAWLSGYDWTFAWAEASTSFVTSDAPFVLLDADGRMADPFAGDVGVASPGVKWVLPLTQEVCLQIGDGAPATRHVRLDRGAVRALNLKQSSHQDRWLIARDEALLRRVID